MAETSFRRYTELPALFHLLYRKELTLLDPSSWDDKNDSFFLQQYKEKKKLKPVLALCFTQAEETYHHWHVFSSGSAGVCVTFKEQQLMSAVGRVPGLQMGSVRYLTIPQMRARRLKIKELPYFKRAPFKPEDEVRMLWESTAEEKSYLPIPIGLSSISRITLSPWLHPSLSASVKEAIATTPGCRSIKVVRSTLIGNEEWKRYGVAAT